MKDLTPEVLTKLYTEDLLTEAEIAQKFGTYQVRVGRLRRKWGIPTLGKTGRLTKTLPDLTTKQRELLVGSLLGDGHLFVRSSTETAGFSEGHSLAQSSYLRWKAQIMEPFTLDVYKGTKTDRGKVYHALCFRTHLCTHLREYYDLFYPEGTRVFPDSLKDIITPFSLAVWYLDDGTLHRKYHPHIAFGLDEVSLHRAIEALKALGLTADLYEGKTNMSIHFPAQDKAFFDLIRQHVPPEMAYKLPVYSDRKKGDINSSKLTSKRADKLYRAGLTFAEIAKIAGVSTSTARRRVQSFGTAPKPKGYRKKRYTRKEAEVILDRYQLSKEEWKARSSQEKETLVEEIYSVLSKTQFPYDEFPDENVPLEVQKLKKLSFGDDPPRTWRGTMMCKRFFPNRYRAISAPAGTSAYEAWFNEKRLKSAIRMQLRYGDPLLPHRVLRAVTAQVRTPTIFRPAVARFLYEKYATPGDLVWDPCSGYGGRLLGAFAAGVRYLATDVDPETVAGNQELARVLGYDCNVVCSPAETFKCPPVDMVFTSPPYFNREKYEGGNQSWKNFQSLDEWVNGFMVPVIQNARAALGGGPLVINIVDLNTRKETIPLVERTIEAAESHGFIHEDTLKMPLSGLNRKNPWEPILVFR